ncbi:hypothetical protein JHK82_012344 [Glycine max]|uniref:Uncharacterized protein n=1 Tax=Glycine soja TaxID=3848 RepID=A0A0B2PL86_GLYSO|nr:hypothetical protein JHK87_012260 [Glycine soja]KAG5040226.1 hypothetical protein JHK85_012702 [Glycine max]KAG5057366.1 hypothetical protein JHK86_012362 [Glycine max]KAG5154375.1 hypothetical protein JHK82_012344 [Glycine max]KAH1249854.1 hypothetical protein GmHk_05G013128 [Glycine max]
MTSNIKINNAMVWIRFLCLGMEYYDESILMALVVVVGKPVKVDIKTINVSHGKFAHICVEIDQNQPVVGRVWFRNTWFNVEYEGMHLICNRYGLYGHTSCVPIGKRSSVGDTNHPKP